MKSNDQLSKGGTLSSVMFFNALSKYIPSLVLQSWIEKQKEEEDYNEQERRNQQRNKQSDRDRKDTLPMQLSQPKQPLPYI
jgi:hypothetical protein